MAGSTVVDERIGARVAVRHAVPDDPKHLVDGSLWRMKAEVSGERLDVYGQPGDAEDDDDGDNQSERLSVAMSAG